MHKLRSLLDASSNSALHKIALIGVGGVTSGLAAERMSSAGASLVGLATALGREGVRVFQRISDEIISLPTAFSLLDDADVHEHTQEG